MQKLSQNLRHGTIACGFIDMLYFSNVMLKKNAPLTWLKQTYLSRKSWKIPKG